VVRIAALILALSLAGCVTQPAVVSAPRSVWCDTNQPRRLSAATVATMSLAEKQDAVAHNRRGALWCGWKP